MDIANRSSRSWAQVHATNKWKFIVVRCGGSACVKFQISNFKVEQWTNKNTPNAKKNSKLHYISKSLHLEKFLQFAWPMVQV